MRDVFSNCHPTVNFLFYITALVMGMCFVHPIFLICSLGLSIAYYLIINKKPWKYLLGMVGLFVTLACVNPLFNPYGNTVLFTYLNHRPYTLEAFGYGIALAAMFVTVITWFATYNKVMTSDKFLYCFGRLTPAVSLILTMVLRMVPQFQKKSGQIGGARKCIGKSVQNGSNYEKAEHGMTIVSVLTSWALEGGVVMADSMRSRGFGCAKRTNFSIYRMRKQDCILLGVMLTLLIGIMVCAFGGGMQVSYVPYLEIAGWNAGRSSYTLIGLICYVLFLALPTALNIMEKIRWHILKSRI